VLRQADMNDGKQRSTSALPATYVTRLSLKISFDEERVEYENEGAFRRSALRD
jgi:hypothetical protein